MFARNLWHYCRFHGTRTNRGLEEWYYRLNAKLSILNPKLYVPIDELTRDCALSVLSMQQIERQESMKATVPLS